MTIHVHIHCKFAQNYFNGINLGSSVKCIDRKKIFIL